MENVLIATVLSFVVTYFSIPILIRVAELKHLYDEPDERKTHKQRIPTLGGNRFFLRIYYSCCYLCTRNSEFAISIHDGCFLYHFHGGDEG